MKRLGIQDLLSRYPSQLSGGQMKRASLAKALLKQSDIILCDEPTGALYHHQAQDVMKYLKMISQDALVIIVSHDPLLLQTYCDSVLTLEDGQLKGHMKQSQKPKEISLKKHQHHTLWRKNIVCIRYGFIQFVNLYIKETSFCFFFYFNG